MKATDFLLYGGTTGTDNSWMSCEMGNHFSGPDASGSPLAVATFPQPEDHPAWMTLSARWKSASFPRESEQAIFCNCTLWPKNTF